MRVVVIGAGVVGLAVARDLASHHEVFVIDREAHVGAGITSRNSEVVHAGIYYAPGSLKARLCVEGRELTYAYLRDKGVHFRSCGKLVVAVEDGEIERLEGIRANAAACGVDDLEWLSGQEVAAIEPAVKCSGALLSRRTGIMDSSGLVRALRSDLEKSAGTVVLHSLVVAARRSDWGYVLVTQTGEAVEEIECEAVVNAAGLYSDAVARLPLSDETLPSLRFVRGSYARLWWPRSSDLAPPARLIYPLPEREGPGLGIHLTIDLLGGLRLGPDVEPLKEKAEDYSVSESILPSFRRAVGRYLHLPSGAELTPDYSGIRPVRVDASGSRDFYIAEEGARGLPGWVNLIGIESPGLTAALAIGRFVKEWL